MSAALEKHQRQGSIPWLFIDLLLWAPAGILALWVRYDFDVPVISSWAFLIFAVSALAHMLLGSALGAYPPGARLNPLGRQSLGVVALSAGTAGIIGTIIISLVPAIGTPRSVPLITALLVIFGVFVTRAARLAWNTYQGRDREPVIVLGAGMLGRHVIAELGEPSFGNNMVVKAVLDDRPALRGSRIHGVKIHGALTRLPEVAEQTGATTVIVAINNTDAATKAMIGGMAATHGLRVLVLPTMDEINRTGQLPLQELDLTALMGREEIVLDEAAIGDLLRGRRVMITGAGGSIGSELARQVHRYDPGELILLDRDEGGLHHTQLSIYGHAMLDSRNVVLGDIRDADRLKDIFLEHRPEVVLHAAALKHLPLLEMYPQEAWLTNVEGTRNVLDASVACGADVVVNVSTDKAANPICVLGDSKRVAERLTAAYGEAYDGLWVSVRFGNVLGSRGSVIETFSGQIEAGGPVTITHPDVRRYFMTIPEAAQLVLQAAVVGESGETLVLDMGSPMSILTLAKSLMRLAGREDLKVIYTGLRPGEKLSEDLVDEREAPTRADRHPMITEVRVEPLSQLPQHPVDAGAVFPLLARGMPTERESLRQVT